MTASHDQVDEDQLLDDVDTQNLREIRVLMDQVDPMPAGLVDRVTFALELEELDAEMAVLVKDELAGVRSAVESAEHAHTVIFESSTVTVMVSVTRQDNGAIMVDGWLSPHGLYRVELRTTSEQRDSHSDDSGRFVIMEAPNELFRLVIRSLDRSRDTPVVITPSIAWKE